MVLEEVFEARADHHYRNLSEVDREAVDREVDDLLAEATEESADHRRQLEALINEFDAETVAFEQIQTLVAEQYGETKPDDFDDLLYDYLHSEELAYKFDDDLIESVENSDAAFGVSRERLVKTLETIREEVEGVERVTTHEKTINTHDRYLRAVYLIQVATNEPAGTSAIADRLDVSPASANEMIGNLEAEGLADHKKYEGVTLTDAGIERARESVEAYKNIDVDVLPDVLDRTSWEGSATDVAGRLASNLVLKHALPNANHRTVVALIQFYIRRLNPDFAMPETSVETYPESYDWREWVNEHINVRYRPLIP